MATGSAPFVRLFFVTEDQRYELVGDHSEELWHLRQRRVTVRGHVVRPAHGLGFPAQIEVAEYRLTDADEP